jgi:hypothetical protein
MAKDYAEINSRLAEELGKKYPVYGDWVFEFEYPGYLTYYNEKTPHTVYFTVGWNSPNHIAIQVNDKDNPVDGDEILFLSDDVDELFSIVKQWLNYLEHGGQKGTFDWHPQGPSWKKREK